MNPIIVIRTILFFFCLETTQSTEYSWSTNIRYRLKTDTSTDVPIDATSSSSEIRSRIGLSITRDKTSAYFVLQDSRILGDIYNSAGVTETTRGLFLHQAYFNFITKESEFQVGRFELALGNQRLIAKNNWNNIGRSFEGVLVKRSRKFGETLLFALPIVESVNSQHDDKKDNVLSGLYSKINLPRVGKESTIEPYLINYQDSISANSYNMYGVRSDVLFGKFGFEGEYAGQTSNYIEAHMLSLNFRYYPSKVSWFKNFSIGIDQISGDNQSTTEEEGFSKYFGARHKHHGYYDYSSHRRYFGHAHEGLKELNLKANLNFLSNSKLLIAMHNFCSYDGNTKYGNELDLVIKRKVNEELSSELGIIFYESETSDNLPAFIYLMVNVNL